MFLLPELARALGAPQPLRACAEALRALRAVWDHPAGLLFHNAKFDLDVAEVHLGLKPPPPEKVGIRWI